MRSLLLVVALLALAAGQEQAQEQTDEAGEKGKDVQKDEQKDEKKGGAGRKAKPQGQPVQQGLVGSPLKLRLTYHIYLFFLGVPIASLVLSAVLFFGYIGLSKSPVDVPLQLS